MQTFQENMSYRSMIYDHRTSPGAYMRRSVNNMVAISSMIACHPRRCLKQGYCGLGAIFEVCRYWWRLGINCKLVINFAVSLLANYGLQARGHAATRTGLRRCNDCSNIATVHAFMHGQERNSGVRDMPSRLSTHSAY